MYSFAVVVWEILTRQLPWAKRARPRDIMMRVFKGERLPIAEHFPNALADVVKACWADEPGSRPTAAEIMERLKTFSV